MVSEGARPWVRGRSGDCDLLDSFGAFRHHKSGFARIDSREYWPGPLRLRGDAAATFQEALTSLISGSIETGGILFREYCFGEENSLSLTEFWGKLGEFCEKLGEFALAHK